MILENLNKDNFLDVCENKEICTVLMPVAITEKDIESVIVGSFEGGSNYWMGWKHSKVWAERPPGIPPSIYATTLILSGKTITVCDREDPDEEATIGLNELTNGIRQYIKETKKWDPEGMDAGDYDCIMQYAAFGKLVFG